MIGETSDFTYGMEVEWGDIPRCVVIPEKLGKWDSGERDIVNLREPYKNVSSDPLGLDPPVGGEINTYPTRGWQGQIGILESIKELFTDSEPTVCCLSHSHIHVHVPGLTEDAEALKRLARYVGDNQEEAIRVAGRYDDTIFGGRKRPPQAKSYMKYDGGRVIPDWRIENLVQHTEDLDSFIKMCYASKDRTTFGRPLRYGINLYCLKHISTVEFRFFRGSSNLEEIADCFLFVERFMEEALRVEGSLPISEVLKEREWRFPPCFFDFDQWEGRAATKHSEKRGKKERKFYEPETLL